jgi:predicted CoA-binding protein
MNWHENLIEQDEQIRDILKKSKTIAVVGIKDESRPFEAAHTVPAYLRSHGYKIIPVNPSYKSFLGIPTVPSLLDIKEPVDIVQVFRAPANVESHAEEALKIQPKVFWMQTGIRHQHATHKLAAAGIKVVQDHCMYMDHLRLIRADEQIESEAA